MYVNKTEICYLKANGNISCIILFKKCTKKILHKESEMFLNDTVYRFSVYPSSIKKEGIFNIHQYLMAKKKFIRKYFLYL